MKTFKWTVEIEVAEFWVADGFDLQNGRDVVDRMGLRESMLPFAAPGEVKAKVISGPARESIAKAQGYDSVRAMNADNKRLAR